MTDKTNTFFYQQLNPYEQCVANRFSVTIASQQEKTVGYPYDQASFMQYSATFRDFTLALKGIQGIENHIDTADSLRKEVRTPCLAVYATVPSKSGVKR